MKFEEVMLLIKAGYTKEEIQAMEAPASAPAPAPEAPEHTPVSAPDPEAPEHTPVSAPDIPALENGQPMDQIMTMLHDMIQQNQQTLQAMQAANIQAARMPEDKKETPEDLIAKIIAPGPTSGKGGK